MTDVNSHFAGRVVEAHQRLDQHDVRLQSLERNEAVADERYRNIQGSLENIESNISRGVWIVVAGIIGALVTFIVKGGLNV